MNFTRNSLFLKAQFSKNLVFKGKPLFRPWIQNLCVAIQRSESAIAGCFSQNVKMRKIPNQKAIACLTIDCSALTFRNFTFHF